MRLIAPPLAVALVRKELGDHATAFRHATLICSIAAVVLAAVDSSPGSHALAVGFACIVWLAAHVSGALGDGEDLHRGVFAARLPASLAATFVARITALGMLGTALIGIALVPHTVAGLIDTNFSSHAAHRFAVTFGALPAALAWAGGTLAIAPLIPRSSLAIAGGPLAMAPVFFLFAKAGLPPREVMTWTAGALLMALAGLLVAAVGFVRGRRLLAPRWHAAAAFSMAALPCYGLAMMFVVSRTSELTTPDPRTWTVRSGQVSLDHSRAQLRVSPTDSNLVVQVNVDLSSGVVHSSGRPRTLHPLHESARYLLTTRLIGNGGGDNLLRTSRGHRYWLERSQIVIARDSGDRERIEIGVDHPVAVCGDALLLRLASWGPDDPERCRILDLARGETFAEPIVDPRNFFACDGTWLIRDAASDRWSALDPLEQVPAEVSWLPTGHAPLHNLGPAHVLLRDSSGAMVIVNLDTSTRTVLPYRDLRPLYPDGPAVLADGTALFRVGAAREHRVLGLCDDGTRSGSPFAGDAVLGGLGKDEVLLLHEDRRQLVRRSVAGGISTPLTLHLREDI